MRERRLHLEFVRGVAALVVVAFHCCIGFFPEFMGIVPGQPAGSGLLGNPLYIFVNGPAAVQLFFVLSGYVLTRSYFEKGDDKTVIRSAFEEVAAAGGPSYDFDIAILSVFSCGPLSFPGGRPPRAITMARTICIRLKPGNTARSELFVRLSARQRADLFSWRLLVQQQHLDHEG